MSPLCPCCCLRCVSYYAITSMKINSRRCEFFTVLFMKFSILRFKWILFSNYFLFIILSVCYCWPVLLTFFKWHSCSILSNLQLYTRCFNENFWPIHSIRYSKNSFSLNSIELIWFAFALLWFALLIFLDIFVLLLYYRCCCCCCCRCWFFFVILFFNSVFLFAASLFAACVQLLCWLIQKCTIFTSTVTVQQRH